MNQKWELSKKELNAEIDNEIKSKVADNIQKINKIYGDKLIEYDSKNYDKCQEFLNKLKIGHPQQSIMGKLRKLGFTVTYQELEEKKYLKIERYLL